MKSINKEYFFNKTVLITGAAGQDGTILTHILKDSAKKLFLIFNNDIINDELINYKNITINKIDLNIKEDFQKFLLDKNIDIIIYCAAVHGPSTSRSKSSFELSYNVNFTSALTALQYCSNKEATFVYLSSGLCFDTNHGTINESSYVVNKCNYTEHKNLVFSHVKYYRERFQTKVLFLWLFNHESIYRSDEFFIPKVCSYIKSILVNKKNTFTLKTLDFWCNWGCAHEYMKAIIDLLSKQIYDDFIIGSSNSYYGYHFIDELFKKYGLNFEEYIDFNSNLSNINNELKISTNKIRKSTKYLNDTIFNVCDLLIKK